MRQLRKKILLVCSEYRDDIETQLSRDGWLVVWANDSRMALAKVRRGWFDITVLISTGKEMDVTETLLTLRDMRPAMPIVVVTDSNAAIQGAGKDLRKISNAMESTLRDLKAMLRSLLEPKTWSNI